jgi:hypothetical protein
VGEIEDFMPAGIRDAHIALISAAYNLDRALDQR